MALTANRDVDHYLSNDQELRSCQVAASVHIYKGAFVGLMASGYTRPLRAGDPFMGIAYEELDNTGGIDGAVAIRVLTVGDFGLSLNGADMSDILRPVYASSDDTLTFAFAGNSHVGWLQDVVSTVGVSDIILRIEQSSRPAKLQGEG